MELGDRIRDKVTAIEGVCTAIAIYLNDPSRRIEMTTVVEGKIVESWLDEHRLELAT
jgi:hypothetical protein